MNTITRTLFPSATTQIRADHAHVLTTFHQYEIDTAPEAKQVLVNSVCRALQIHAQLEEEIFYPAMYAIDPATVDKNVPEHDEMRRLIASLLIMSPIQPGYDSTFMELMRQVMRHMADEETIALPTAERVLGDGLNELAEMTARRVELTLPRAGEIANDTLRALPTSLMFAGSGAVIAGTYVLRHALRR